MLQNFGKTVERVVQTAQLVRRKPQGERPGQVMDIEIAADRAGHIERKAVAPPHQQQHIPPQRTGVGIIKDDKRTFKGYVRKNGEVG